MDIKHFADIMHEVYFETSTSEFQMNVQYVLNFKLSGYFWNTRSTTLNLTPI